MDLVIERDGRLYGLDVKATATPVGHPTETLFKWLQLAGPDAQGVLARRVQTACSIAPRIRAVPWHLAWVDETT